MYIGMATCTTGHTRISQLDSFRIINDNQRRCMHKDDIKVGPIVCARSVLVNAVWGSPANFLDRYSRKEQSEMFMRRKIV